MYLWSKDPLGVEAEIYISSPHDNIYVIIITHTQVLKDRGYPVE